MAAWAARFEFSRIAHVLAGQPHPIRKKSQILQLFVHMRFGTEGVPDFNGRCYLLTFVCVCAYVEPSLLDGSRMYLSDIGRAVAGPDSSGAASGGLIRPSSQVAEGEKLRFTWTSVVFESSNRCCFQLGLDNEAQFTF